MRLLGKRDADRIRFRISVIKFANCLAKVVLKGCKFLTSRHSATVKASLTRISFSVQTYINSGTQYAFWVGLITPNKRLPCALNVEIIKAVIKRRNKFKSRMSVRQRQVSQMSLEKEGIPLSIPLDSSHLLFEFFPWFVLSPETRRVDMLVFLVPSPVHDLRKRGVHIRPFQIFIRFGFETFLWCFGRSGVGIVEEQASGS